MNARAATLLSVIHGVGLGLNLLQQVVFAATFGVGNDAGLLFLALTVPSMVALIFSESLQMSLLPELARHPSLDARLTSIARFWKLAIILQLVGLMAGVVWGEIVSAKIGPAWTSYLAYTAVASLAFSCAMIAATILVWLQAERNMVRPSMVHIVPGLAVITVTLITRSVAWVAVTYLAVGAAQMALLWRMAPTLRRAWRSRLPSTIKSKDSIWRHAAPLVIGSALPLIQLMDRLAYSVQGLSKTASAAYLWAFVMGFAAVVSRGPTLVFSVWIVSIAEHGRRRAAALPFLLYMTGNFAGLVAWFVQPGFWSLLTLNFPEKQAMISEMAAPAGPLLLALGPLMALPALHRMIAQLRGVGIGAIVVLLQLAFQALLSMRMLGIGDIDGYAVAISGHAACWTLIGLSLILHSRHPAPAVVI